MMNFFDSASLLRSTSCLVRKPPLLAFVASWSTSPAGVKTCGAYACSSSDQTSLVRPPSSDIAASRELTAEIESVAEVPRKSSAQPTKESDIERST